MGSAGPGFGSGTKGKLAVHGIGAWVVHGIGAQCWLGGRGHGLLPEPVTSLMVGCYISRPSGTHTETDYTILLLYFEQQAEISF